MPQLFECAGLLKLAILRRLLRCILPYCRLTATNCLSSGSTCIGQLRSYSEALFALFSAFIWLCKSPMFKFLIGTHSLCVAVCTAFSISCSPLLPASSARHIISKLESLASLTLVLALGLSWLRSSAPSLRTAYINMYVVTMSFTSS